MSLMLRAFMLGCSVAIFASFAAAQDSHRLLPLPGDSAGSGNQASAKVDLLRQLQQAVEQSARPSGPQFDPSQIDPKLLGAVQELAAQLGQDAALAPQMKDWLEALRQMEQPSVPATLPGFDPNQLPVGTPNDNQNSPPSGVPGPKADPQPPSIDPGDRFSSPPPGRPLTPQAQPGIDPKQPTPKGQATTGNGTGPKANTAEPRLPRETPPPKLTDNPTPPRNANLEQLRESGMSLQKQFSRVVEQARREAILNKGGSSAKPEERSGIAGMLDDAFTKVGEELTEKLKQGRGFDGLPKTNPKRNTPREHTPPTANRPNGPSLSNRIEAMSQRADRFTRSITSAQLPAVPDSPKLPAFQGPSGTTGGSILLVLAMVAGIAAIALGLYWLQRYLSPQRDLLLIEGERALRTLNEMATRADVVRAFHALAGLTSVREHRWWTHRRAASAWATASPQTSQSVEALTEVYEQARYLPADEPLPAEQLRRAREAIRSLMAAQPALAPCGDQ